MAREIFIRYVRPDRECAPELKSDDDREFYRDIAVGAHCIAMLLTTTQHLARVLRCVQR